MKITFGGRKDKLTAPVVIKPGSQSRIEISASGQKTVVLGAGKPADMNRRVRQAVSLAKANQIQKLTLKFSDFIFPTLDIEPEETAELMGQNLELANFEFTRYKTKPDVTQLKEVIITGRIDESVKRALRKGKVISEETNACRALSNTPGGEMTPILLAEAARMAAEGLPIAVKILGPKEMSDLKMGGILGVAKGSAEEPRFISLEYMPVLGQRPTVLVGKGVTFDTGGLNLKPSEGIYEMHMDMSGGAAVIHAIRAAARLKLKKNIIALVPAVENMPSGTSYRPGDILHSMSGKTIEVLNTDAEGRIILADALTYAKQFEPRLVVDVATLTGAAMVALGQRASALFTKSEKLEALFRTLGEEVGDFVWPLPLWDEYESEIKGTFGDFANIGRTKYGGAIHGAIFLYQFAKQYDWVHLDIAPRMTSIEGEFLARGAVGAPVRLLVRVLETF
jgi:leucyl aminopeptidase